MMWFQVILTMLTPVAMLAVGLRWRKHPPRRECNGLAYRTALSEQNEDTWRFAHAHLSKLWVRLGPGPGGGVRRGGVFWPEPAGDVVSVAHRGADDLSVPVRLSGGRPAEGQLQRGREPGEKAVSPSPSPSCFYMKTDCRFYTRDFVKHILI